MNVRQRLLRRAIDLAMRYERWRAARWLREAE
jgi:hypothetical protein